MVVVLLKPSALTAMVVICVPVDLDIRETDILVKVSWLVYNEKRVQQKSGYWHYLCIYTHSYTQSLVFCCDSL